MYDSEVCADTRRRMVGTTTLGAVPVACAVAVAGTAQVGRVNIFSSFRFEHELVSLSGDQQGHTEDDL